MQNGFIQLHLRGDFIHKIILFDGECNLCDKSVQFIIKRDPKGVFKFASLQSKVGKELMTSHHIPLDTDTFVLLNDNKWYAKSTAALRVCSDLPALWKLFSLLLIIPKFIRDPFYMIVSNNRYRWFGKQNKCIIQTPDIRKRFLS